MPGYSEVSTPTKSTAGGVMLYISNCFAFKSRLDLDACLYLPRLLESVFVEIVLLNKPNIIIGLLKSFNSEYLKPFLYQLSSENKQLILLVDFNVNFLKVKDDPESSTFLDALGSNLLLPQIFQQEEEGTLTPLSTTFFPMPLILTSQAISGSQFQIIYLNFVYLIRK